MTERYHNLLFPVKRNNCTKVTHCYGTCSGTIFLHSSIAPQNPRVAVKTLFMGTAILLADCVVYGLAYRALFSRWLKLKRKQYFITQCRILFVRLCDVEKLCLNARLKHEYSIYWNWKHKSHPSSVAWTYLSSTQSLVLLVLLIICTIMIAKTRKLQKAQWTKSHVHISPLQPCPTLDHDSSKFRQI